MKVLFSLIAFVAVIGVLASASPLFGSKLSKSANETEIASNKTANLLKTFFAKLLNAIKIDEDLARNQSIGNGRYSLGPGPFGHMGDLSFVFRD